MIAEGKVQEVERLLADRRQSHRAIAKLVGVSRAVVGQIAAGARPDYAARRLARQEAEYEPRGPVARCRQCGGRVYMPCYLCKVRAIKSAEQAQRRAERLRERARADRRLLELLRNPPQRRERAAPQQRWAG
jgi:hypothetical protein